MKLTNKEQYKLCGIIIRFLKENNFYNLKRTKDLLGHMLGPIYDSKKTNSFFNRTNFFENTLQTFASLYLTKTFDIATQLRFVKFIKQYLSCNTQELFLEFLKTKNITFEQLIGTFNRLYWEGCLSKTMYDLRKDIIYSHNPHIIVALDTYKPRQYLQIGGKDVRIDMLKLDWEVFYSKQQKLKNV